MIRLYEEIVGRGGVSPAYFFYRMTWAEAAAYMRGREMKEREEWERARRLMWASLVPHAKNKNFEPSDVIKFPWEKGFIDTSQVDEKELERVRNLAKKFEK